jgi:hypothetical protein
VTYENGLLKSYINNIKIINNNFTLVLNKNINMNKIIKKIFGSAINAEELTYYKKFITNRILTTKEASLKSLKLKDFKNYKECDTLILKLRKDLKKVKGKLSKVNVIYGISPLIYTREIKMKVLEAKVEYRKILASMKGVSKEDAILNKEIDSLNKEIKELTKKMEKRNKRSIVLIKLKTM